MQSPSSPQPDSPGASPRYWAFISYSQRDRKWGEWLHRSLEGYRVPKPLVGRQDSGEPVPARLFPVFRDRDELASAADLGGRLNDALAQSRFLIVICSPHAAQSRWVNEEIKAYKRLGGAGRILALIVDGEPFAVDQPAIAAQECFPEALRHAVDAAGQVLPQRVEPIAADARPDKDGKRYALLKLLAGLLGVPYDILRQRTQERRIRQLTALGVVLSGLVVLFAWLLWKSIVAERLAVSRAQVALSRQLAAQSLRLRDSRADLASLLAVEALNTAPTVEAHDSLLNALIESPQLLGYLHGGGGVEFSADGRRLAGQDDYGIVVWDLGTRKPIAPPLARSEFGYNLTASPDHKLLANVTSESGQRLVGVWDFDSGKLLAQRIVAPGEVSALVFTPDSKALLAATEAGGLHAWEAISGRQLPPPVKGAGGRVTGLRFSPDGKWLAIQRTSDVLLVDWRSGVALPPTSTGHDGGITQMAFSPDSRWLATGGRTGTVMFWDIARRARAAIRDTHEGPVTGLAFSPDGRMLASAAADGKIVLTHAAQFIAMEPALTTGDSWPGKLAFSPDGSLLISAGREVRMWDMRGRMQVNRPIAGIDDPDELAAANPDQSGRLPTGVRIVWRIGAGAQLARTLPELVPDITGLGFGRDGTLYAWNADGAVRMSSASAPPEPMALPGKLLALSAATNTLAVQLPEGIASWDLSGSKLLGSPVPIGSDTITSAAFSGTGDTLVLGMQSGRVVFFQPAGASAVRDAPANLGGTVWSVAASLDGKYLAAGADDSTPLLWEAKTGRLILQPDGDPGVPLWGLAFNPKRPMLAVGDNMGKITLWSVAARSGPRGLPLLGHKSADATGFGDRAVSSLAIAPDGERMVSGGADRNLVLWHLAAGQWTGRALSGHAQRVQRVAFDADGKRVASGSAEGTVLLWDMDPASWKQRACRLANRNLSEAEWRLYMADVPYRATCADLPRFDPDCSSVLVNYFGRLASEVCKVRRVENARP